MPALLPDPAVYIPPALPANSSAALGVLRAAWRKLLSSLPYPKHPNLEPYCEAILRHEQVGGLVLLYGLFVL